ncbi:hypothetical protein ABGV42_00430 [Paenibacillus pabuli]|uniref:hypothetical protein n=1 Tax=Paenibacillus pabuli TaxID=1472 RepID=UPI003242A450
MKLILPDHNADEYRSREGLHVVIDKSHDRNIGYYAVVHNKYGYQVSDTQYAYRKRELTNLTVDDFTISDADGE